jgi:hypothetical protein
MAKPGPRPYFDSETRRLSPLHGRLYRLYEIAYTAVDFLAGLMFVIGSVMFFYPAWQDTGTWLFLFGSILFVLRPTVRLMREMHFARLPLPGEDAPDG